MPEGLVSGILSQGAEITEQIIHTHGLQALALISLSRGLMLFWIAPDEVATVSYVLFATESVLEVAAVVLISSVFILIGNSFVFLLFRWLGERLVSDEKKSTRIWRFLNWAFDRNGKFSILLFRMTPLIGGDWVAIFSGMTDMDFREYLIYSFIAILIYEALIGFGTYYGVKMGMLYELESPLVHSILEFFEGAVY